MPPPSNSQHERNAATFAALFGLLVACGALLGLAALVIPDILFVMLVLAGVTGLGALQYVLWGWRLDRFRVADDEESPAPVNTSTSCARGLKWGSIAGPVVGIVTAFGLQFAMPGLLPSEVSGAGYFMSIGCWGIPGGALTGSLTGSCLDFVRHRDRASLVLTLALGCLWAMVIGFPLLVAVKVHQ